MVPRIDAVAYSASIAGGIWKEFVGMYALQHKFHVISYFFSVCRCITKAMLYTWYASAKIRIAVNGGFHITNQRKPFLQQGYLK